MNSSTYIAQRFETVPNVFVTSAHKINQNSQDAASIWVEDPSVNSFKICFRELVSFDGVHRDLDVVSVCLAYEHVV